MFRKFWFYFMGLPLVLGLGACSSNDELVEDNVKNLSAAGLANCYIVQSPGLYKFKADNMFNQGEGLPVPPEISPDSATLIWQTVPSSVSSVEIISEKGETYIQFEIKEARGNVLLAALDEDGNIEWSWHIWMPEENIESMRTATGYDVMTMNLGAMNNKPGDAASYGMLYQWGRKDPFPAAGTLTGDTQTVSAPMYDIENNEVTISNSSWYNTNDNTLEYAIAHPTVCLSNYSQYSTNRDWLKESQDNLWGNPNGDLKDNKNEFINSGKKTCYDPSPLGWRVAPADAFSNLTTTGGYAWTLEDFNVKDTNGDGKIDLTDYYYGWTFNVSPENALYFPAAARFDGSYAMLMGSVSGLWGSYWSNSPYSGMKGGAFCALSFQVKDQSGKEAIAVSPSGGASRADAYSVRCIRDN